MTALSARQRGWSRFWQSSLTRPATACAAAHESREGRDTNTAQADSPQAAPLALTARTPSEETASDPGRPCEIKVHMVLA